jgi:hypothetical protein
MNATGFSYVLMERRRAAGDSNLFLGAGRGRRKKAPEIGICQEHSHDLAS